MSTKQIIKRLEARINGLERILMSLTIDNPLYRIYLYCDEDMSANSINIVNKSYATIKNKILNLRISNEDDGKLYLSGYIHQDDSDNDSCEVVQYDMEPFYTIEGIMDEISLPKKGQLITISNDKFYNH